MLKAFKELSSLEKSQVTETYIDVFSSPPWNEAFICPQCNNYHGKEFRLGMPCSKGCASNLEVVYTPEKTLKDLEAEAEKPGALALAAFNGSGEPIGMSIGFPWTYEDFLSKYPEQYQPTIAQFFEDAKLKGEMFYGSDVFVSPRKQQKGTGTKLTLPWKQAAEDLGMDLFFRTNTNSGMAKIGLQTIGAEQVFGQRVDLVPDVERGGNRLVSFEDQLVYGRDPQAGNRILMRRAALNRRVIVGGI